ncbi:hypothetical protein [Bacillus sp. CECT 9360]|uniref:hypothetical protein n=1 Tax=Bacillus sp. CECT 9360 TaxID=2845821 RepID=UPI001E3227DA|nr:hypothetical protein [Bacillus sp. CECT 9360]CAH0345061.1 hypothetical protein BCI9360_01338 [Bacillus sp. CECT 9360]
MKKGFIFFVTVLLAIMTGCGVNEDRDSTYEGESRDGTTLISNKPGKSVNNRGDAAEQPSDQLLNSPGSNSNITPTTGSEVKKARAVVEENTDFEAGAVWLKGKTLSVTIHERAEFHSNEERNREKERVRELLKQALPRYNIEVNMKTDKD